MLGEETIQTQRTTITVVESTCQAATAQKTSEECSSRDRSRQKVMSEEEDSEEQANQKARLKKKVRTILIMLAITQGGPRPACLRLRQPFTASAQIRRIVACLGNSYYQ
jgi:hypothetical protein